MPVIAPIHPTKLRQVLEHWDYVCIHEDEFHYLMARREGKARPILIPKDVTPEGTVAIEVMEYVLGEAKIDHYQYFAIMHTLAGGAPN